MRRDNGEVGRRTDGTLLILILAAVWPLLAAQTAGLGGGAEQCLHARLSVIIGARLHGFGFGLPGALRRSRPEILSEAPQNAGTRMQRKQTFIKNANLC
jgi:hypothetical protein